MHAIMYAQIYIYMQSTHLQLTLLLSPVGPASVYGGEGRKVKQ